MSVSPIDESRIFAITRPHPLLLVQYFFWSMAGVVFFPFVLVPLLFKYHTLRYRFDPEGISMSWGFLFRREINLTYSRIQDIHLTRGIIERWLGLGTLSIQTASGSAAAEMAIPGLAEYEALRDFLYARMRGGRTRAAERPTYSASAQAHGTASAAQAPALAGAPGDAVAQTGPGAEALELLRHIHADLKEVRRSLQSRLGQDASREESRL